MNKHARLLGLLMIFAIPLGYSAPASAFPGLCRVIFDYSDAGGYMTAGQRRFWVEMCFD